MIPYKQLSLADFLPIAKINLITISRHLLYPMLRALLLQLIFSIPTTSPLIVFLKYSQELRDFCGFDVVPDASKFTRFKQDFLSDLQSMFDRLVNLTEPICQRIDKHKASMPSHAASNPAIQQMYINGHFCYAYKFGMITNGLGIVRDISFYNRDFLDDYPERKHFMQIYCLLEPPS